MDIRKREFNIRKNSAEAAAPIIKTQEFGKKYGSYLAAAFVCLIVVFVFIMAKWVLGDSDASAVKKNLETELLKNPVNSALPAENKTAASASQSQTAQTAQTSQTQTVASKSETESASTSENNATAETVEADTETKKFESTKFKVAFDYSEGVSVSEGDKLITVTQKGISWKIRFYDNKNKKDFKDWYIDHFNIETEANCTFADAAIKVGSYDSKLVEPASDDVECDGEGNYATNSDKSRVVKVEIGKETKENVNKILEGFKFVE